MAALALLGACGGDGKDRVLVSAASSLADAFAEIEAAFETKHPGTDVVLNLAGSSLLREQIVSGAPVDVFASASVDIMADVAEAGGIDGQSVVFAANPIQIAVPPGNPAGVTGLPDFTRPELFIGLCAPEVPCGELARETFQQTQLIPAPDTNEPNVRALLTKIEVGELDAGIVYATDVQSGEVEGIAIPADVVRFAHYPIAQIAEAPNPGLASQFVSFVLSPEGDAILAKHGFESP